MERRDGAVRGIERFSLEGRRALVTGASRGLGEGMARGLAAAGASVALVARGADALAEVAESIRAEGGAAHPVAADVGTMAGVRAAYDGAVAALGGVDILINAAGTNRRKPIVETTEEDFDFVVDLNLKGVYFLSQLVAREMIGRGSGGKIVHVASLTSTIAIPGTSVYGATKSAMHSLARSMALEWAPHNIQVNAIAPGYFFTELTRPLFENPERRAWIMSRTPAGRSGLPDDLVGAAVFLSSPASDYFTGQMLNVDGGWLAS